MAGKWKASSGYTVHIPDNSGSFILIFEDIKSERITHPAQWKNIGKEFTWTDKQGAGHTATLDPGNPDRICDINSSYPESRKFSVVVHTPRTRTGREEIAETGARLAMNQAKDH